MIYRLHPSWKVFIDGRLDLYGRGHIVDMYLPALQGLPTRPTRRGRPDKPGWRQILNKHDVRAVLIPPDAGLVYLLSHDPKWDRIYKDHMAVVFVIK